MIHLPWTHKPPYGVKLNRQHPLAQGLVGCWLMNEGGGLKIFDLCNKNTGQIITTGVLEWVPEGLGKAGNYNPGDYVDIGEFPQLSKLTILTNTSYTSNAHTYDRIIQRGNADSYGFSIRWYENSFLFQDFQVSASNNEQTNTVTVDTHFNVCCTSNRINTTKIFLDGVLQAGSFSDSGGSIGSDLEFFKRSGAATSDYDGKIKYVFIWDKELTESEVNSISFNPYQIFEPLFIPSYYSAPSTQLLQVGDKYQVVWNGSEFVLTYTDDLALPSGTTIHIGLDPVDVEEEAASSTEDDLTANDISSVSSTGSPAIGQEHDLTPSSIASISVTGTPELTENSGTDELHVSAIASVTSTGTPALAQEHDLTSSGLTAASATGEPVIGQEHALSVTGIASASINDEPTIGQEHDLSNSGLTSVSVTGTPEVSETSEDVDVLSVNDTTIISSVGSPGIEQVHDLDISDVSIVSEVGTPIAGHVHDLTSTAIISASLVGTPSIGQAHNLTISGLTSISVLETPALGQEHDLTNSDITSTTDVGNPSIGQAEGLTPSNIASTSSTGTPTLGHIHNLSAVTVAAVPALGTPVIGQIHVLTSSSIAAAVIMGSTKLDWVQPTVPHDRIEIILPETRTYVVSARDPPITVLNENRTYIVPFELIT